MNPVRSKIPLNCSMQIKEIRIKLDEGNTFCNDQDFFKKLLMITIRSALE